MRTTQKQKTKKAISKTAKLPAINKKAVFGTTAVVAVASIATFSAITRKLQKQVLFPKKAELLPLPEQLATETSLEFDQNFFEFDMYDVITPDGYVLEASILPASQPSRKFIVLVHGITQNLKASLKFYPIFHKLGYNIITYSQRNHGNNADAFTTFGIQEKFDLKTVIDDLYQRFGNDIYVGIHGVSMGAATVLQYVGLSDTHVAFAISDCAYSDALAEFQYRLKVEYPLLRWLPFVQANRLLTKISHKIDLADASPIATISTVQTPILFIHGLSDSYILYGMSQQLYNAKTTGYRDLWLVPDAEHDNCLETDTQGYLHKVSEFLATI